MNSWGFSTRVLFGSLLSSTHINWALPSGWELVVCIIARQIMPLDFSMETRHEICPGNRKLPLQIYFFGGKKKTPPQKAPKTNQPNKQKNPKQNKKPNKHTKKPTNQPKNQNQKNSKKTKTKKPQAKKTQPNQPRQNQPPIFVPVLYFLSSIPGSDHWRILGTHTSWGWTPQTVSWGLP